MIHLHGDRYSITYAWGTSSATIAFQGTLRLYGGHEYESIMDFLYTIAAHKPGTLILNLRELGFLNSAGINVLYKFVIHVRDFQASQFVVQGAQQMVWQSKLLSNFQRLMPAIIVEWNGHAHEFFPPLDPITEASGFFYINKS